jgi:uncharacterized membrane protein YjfL (UPF0719 family)
MVNLIIIITFVAKEGVLSVDDAESCLYMGFIIGAAWAWLAWYWSLLRVSNFVSPAKFRQPLLVTPLICFGLLWFVLTTLASFDVVNNFTYLSFYMLFGATWLGFAVYIFPYWGVSPRDDVIERRNTSATYAIVGALIGVTFCFAGGNIGDGPGWWVVLFVASLATISFFVVWMILELATKIGESVTIDRDPSAGVRLGGFLIAAGLILGRGAAGDYKSLEQQFTDFAVHGAPVLILLLVAIVLESFLRPRVSRPMSSALLGVLPALVYIGGAAFVVWSLGAV